MVDFFRSVADFLAVIWNYIINIITSTISAIGTIVAIPTSLVSLLGVLPDVIGGCMMIVVSIAIVKLIVGWGNSQ